ncbi:MAG: GerMN domain-containing protein [Synergistales bacterium]|nr:GerMN domain-containing protein [Synergistales bacterium]
MHEENDQFDLEHEVVRKRKKRSTDRTQKAPLPYRIVAWAALALVCFGMGYFGTSLALNMLNKRDIALDQTVVSDRESAVELLEGQDIPPEVTTSSASARKVSYTFYYPGSSGILQKEAALFPGLMEEDITQVISLLSEASKETGFLEKEFTIYHVFRSGEMLFLDLDPSFEGSIIQLGPDKASILMTGIVRTMVENFPPVKKVKILIKGRMPDPSLPIDLSLPWQLSY